MHSHKYVYSTNCLLKLGMCVYIEIEMKFQQLFEEHDKLCMKLSRSADKLTI
jgi:hypothetical protein